MPVEIPKEKWPGAVRTITLGATAADGGTRSHTVTIGGETALPFMHFESETPNPPKVAIEIKDHRPEDWSPLLLDAWKDVIDDPAKWAKAAEEAGADLIVLALSLNDVDGNPTTPDGSGQSRQSGAGSYRVAPAGLWTRAGRSG